MFTTSVLGMQVKESVQIHTGLYEIPVFYTDLTNIVPICLLEHCACAKLSCIHQAISEIMQNRCHLLVGLISRRDVSDVPYMACVVRE